METKDGFYIVSAGLTILVTGAGIVMALLRSIFMTKSACEKKHESIINRLNEMDEVRNQARKLQHKKDLWLVDALHILREGQGNGTKQFPPYPTE